MLSMSVCVQVEEDVNQIQVLINPTPDSNQSLACHGSAEGATFVDVLLGDDFFAHPFINLVV